MVACDVVVAMLVWDVLERAAGMVEIVVLGSARKSCQDRWEVLS